MFIRFNREDGRADAIYRTPERILEDINRIKAELRDIRQRLNFRSLVLDILSDERIAHSPDVWIDEIEGLLADAREAEKNMRELEDELCELREELRETRWALGMQ